MDAEEKWKATARDVETLHTQMVRKVREIDTVLSDLQMLQRQLERTRVQEMYAWKDYQQSLRERGL